MLQKQTKTEFQWFWSTVLVFYNSLFKQEKYVEAKEWIEKAIKLDESDNAELLEHFGDILYKLNEIDEAVKMWERAKAAGEGSVELDEKIKARKIND